ncbi:MAG: hypothetical protein JO045_07480 [Mycobacterium sp.]|nr:hypothetical protein [Mycobacterium sp.]
MNVIDRYRRWNRLAYLSTSEKRLNRSLWALLVVSVDYAVSHHVRLVNIPAFVSWGPPFGVVCYDLAIAYAGAFTFYLLNIRLPLRRDRQNIYRHVGPLVGLIVTQADQLITTLNKTARIEPPDRENTWENIKELCSIIGPNTVEGNLFIGTKGVGAHTVFTLIVDNMQRTRSWIDRILSFSSFLATDLIDLLSAFEAYSHFRLASEQLLMVQTGLTIGTNDLSLWAGRIFNYTILIRELKTYGQKYLTMTYEDRPGLVWSEDNPNVPKPD